MDVWAMSQLDMNGGKDRAAWRCGVNHVVGSHAATDCMLSIDGANATLRRGALVAGCRIRHAKSKAFALRASYLLKASHEGRDIVG
jgi:hypothetical protein